MVTQTPQRRRGTCDAGGAAGGVCATGRTVGAAVPGVALPGAPSVCSTSSATLVEAALLDGAHHLDHGGRTARPLSPRHVDAAVRIGLGLRLQPGHKVAQIHAVIAEIDLAVRGDAHGDRVFSGVIGDALALGRSTFTLDVISGAG